MTEQEQVAALTKEISSNSAVMSVIGVIVGQQMKGLEKYGKLIHVDLYDTVGWIDHAMQECADKLIYLQCIKDSILKDMKKPLD